MDGRYDSSERFAEEVRDEPGRLRKLGEKLRKQFFSPNPITGTGGEISSRVAQPLGATEKDALAIDRAVNNALRRNV
jgi:hypothetical protein